MRKRSTVDASDCSIGEQNVSVDTPFKSLVLKLSFNRQYVLHIFCKCLFYYFVIKYALKAFGVYDLVSEFFVTKTNDFYITK